jgi:hypothetical protein
VRDMMRASRAHRVGASVSKARTYLMLEQLVHPCAQVALVMRASNTSAPSADYHACWCAACACVARRSACECALPYRACARAHMASSSRGDGAGAHL